MSTKTRMRRVSDDAIQVSNPDGRKEIFLRHVHRYEPTPDVPYEKQAAGDEKKLDRKVLYRTFYCPGCLDTQERVVVDRRASKESR